MQVDELENKGELDVSSEDAGWIMISHDSLKFKSKDSTQYGRWKKRRRRTLNFQRQHIPRLCPAAFYVQ
eukprot:888194-Ditylum_brightwellii.AAC.1